jgi:hypothetical protein
VSLKERISTIITETKEKLEYPLIDDVVGSFRTLGLGSRGQQSLGKKEAKTPPSRSGGLRQTMFGGQQLLIRDFLETECSNYMVVELHG